MPTDDQIRRMCHRFAQGLSVRGLSGSQHFYTMQMIRGDVEDQLFRHVKCWIAEQQAADLPELDDENNDTIPTADFRQFLDDDHPLLSGDEK